MFKFHISMSLDGFVTAIGVLVMGNRIFDVGEVPWGDDPP